MKSKIKYFAFTLFLAGSLFAFNANADDCTVVTYQFDDGELCDPDGSSCIVVTTKPCPRPVI